MYKHKTMLFVYCFMIFHTSIDRWPDRRLKRHTKDTEWINKAKSEWERERERRKEHYNTRTDWDAEQVQWKWRRETQVVANRSDCRRLKQECRGKFTLVQPLVRYDKSLHYSVVSASVYYYWWSGSSQQTSEATSECYHKKTCCCCCCYCCTMKTRGKIIV